MVKKYQNFEKKENKNFIFVIKLAAILKMWKILERQLVYVYP